MKKIILLIIISLIIFMNTENRAFTMKHIDLRLKENEVAIVFLRLKKSNSILVNKNNKSNLFILEYKDDNELKEALKIFKTKPNIYYLNSLHTLHILLLFYNFDSYNFSLL